MAISVVKVPKNPNIDYDFIAFTFDGIHSYEDMNIVRVSDGDRYNENLVPTINDLTADVPGGDGMYYFSTTHKQKVFDISFAFNNLEESKLMKMKQWLSGKKMADLWFAEAPYKVYTAKVTGQPNLKTLCFEENGKRIYKGEGTVQFTAYWPYAHTPDLIQRWDTDQEQWVDIGSGLVATNYIGFRNYEQFRHHLPSIDYHGDLPFYFVADLIEPKYITTSVIELDTTKTNGLSIEYTDATVTMENGVARINFQEAGLNE